MIYWNLLIVDGLGIQQKIQCGVNQLVFGAPPFLPNWREPWSYQRRELEQNTDIGLIWKLLPDCSGYAFSLMIRLHSPVTCQRCYGEFCYCCRVENACRLVSHCGVNVLMMEYRGYGRSGGEISEQGMWFVWTQLYAWLHLRPNIS